MNPFSRFLSQWSNHQPLEAFIQGWDELERLAIGVYKSGRPTAEQTAAYAALRPRLQAQYPPLADELAPLWREAKVAGKLATNHPFAFLLAAEQAADFVNNWAALQHLPAAREALNQRLVALGQTDRDGR